MKTRHSGLLDEIRSTGVLPEDQVKAAVESFKATFQASVEADTSGGEADRQWQAVRNAFLGVVSAD